MDAKVGRVQNFQTLVIQIGIIDVPLKILSDYYFLSAGVSPYDLCCVNFSLNEVS